MKTLILNGNPDYNNTAFESYIHGIKTKLINEKIEVNVLNLRELIIHPCTGCFGCWVKTPGKCIFKDESILVDKEIMSSQLIIFASPVIMGFTTSLLKRAHDKIIPLLLPYIEIIQNEFHHQKRYERYPLMGLLLQPDGQTDKEDIEIINNIYRRDSINFHSSLVFSILTTDDIDKAVSKISNSIKNHNPG